jgi:hypothetical protein
MTPIAERVLQAFSQIESKDLRVTRLLMPENLFWKLNKEFNEQHGHTMFNHTAHDPHRGDDYALWGAHVEFSNHFEAIADGWIARETNTGREILELRDPIAIAKIQAKPWRPFEIIIRSRGDSVYLNKCSSEERIALETLREYITEKEFRRYLRDRFLLVHGSSGKIYQIFRDRWHTKVWWQGQLIEEICVRLNSNVPPTDNVIAFAHLLLTNEEEFRKLGNVYNMQKKVA